MTRRPALQVIVILLTATLLAHSPLWAKKEPPPSESAFIDDAVLPDGTFLGHASEEQARELAALLLSHHHRAMETLTRLEGEPRETRRLIRQDLVMAQRLLGLLEAIAERQGSGEITLFFNTGADTFAENGPQHRRLVRFLDHLARESRGRPLFFISIGSASSPGSEEANRALSERRAHFPRHLIEHYLVNTPHAFYELYGIGEPENPEDRKPTSHRRHQHTRLIAFYADKSPTAPDMTPRDGAKTAQRPPPAGQQTEKTLGMAFAWIPPGTFTMGSPPGEPGRDSDETPHEVTLTRGFYMQTTEVTQAQWNALMESDPSYYKECGGNCPVNRVCWTDAMEFIRRLNTREAAGMYRLPTEAEWEYACRAGSQDAFSNGPLKELACAYDTNMDKMGWHKGNAGKGLHEAAQKTANAWGLFDMHGNIWEWCQDRKGPYGDRPRTDPTGPTRGEMRVIRGGSWSSDDRDCRSANRLYATECTRNAGIGFRLVMEK